MSRKHTKTELFEQLPIPKAVAELSIPCVVSSLVMVLYNLADTYFVGKLNDPLENAAVSLAAPVLLAFNAVNNLFGVGCASRMSRCLGVRDHEGVRETSAFGIYMAIICGLMFSLFCTVFQPGLLELLGADAEDIVPTKAYLLWTVSCGAAPSILNVVMANLVRAEGSALHAAIGTMSGCLLNMILDPFFILPGGFGMGAAGAGLATFISNCAACVYFFIMISVKGEKTFVSFRPKHFRLKKEMLRDVFGVGGPAAIQNLLNVSGMTILNKMMSVYGAAAVGAIGIAHKITMIPMYATMGVTQGIMPLIGYNYAARNASRMKKGVRFTLWLGLGLELVLTALYFSFPGEIMSLFSKDADILAFGTGFTRTLCLAQPFLFVDFMAVAVFQACGMGSRSFLFAVLRKLALEIPAQYVLRALFGMNAIPYAQLIAEAVLAVAAALLLRKIFRSTEEWDKPAGQGP